MSYLLIQGDARRIPLTDQSIHMICSSPPYFGLRDYGTGEWIGGDPACSHKMPRQANRMNRSISTLHSIVESANIATWPVCGRCGATRKDLQIGLEESPDLYVDATRAVFRELWRVLRNDGVVFWNIGESYNAYNGNRGSSSSISGKNEEKHPIHSRGLTVSNLKPKDVIGIPYRLAMAIQSDGWYWRDTIIWAKAEMVDDELDGSGMPGSQQDRCTNGYEVVLQFTKSDRYFFDVHGERSSSGATLRNVWRINTEPNRLGHFALMPRKLAERCIRLGTSERGCCPACGSPWRRLIERQRIATRPGNNSKVHGRVSVHSDSPYHDQNGVICGNRDPKRHTTVYQTIGWEPTCRCKIGHTKPCRVLDPFGGLSTTAVAADTLGRIGITIDLSRKYCTTAYRRLSRPHARVIHPTAREESHPLFSRSQP